MGPWTWSKTVTGASTCCSMCTGAPVFLFWTWSRMTLHYLRVNSSWTVWMIGERCNEEILAVLANNLELLCAELYLSLHVIHNLLADHFGDDVSLQLGIPWPSLFCWKARISLLWHQPPRDTIRCWICSHTRSNLTSLMVEVAVCHCHWRRLMPGNRVLGCSFQE